MFLGFARIQTDSHGSFVSKSLGIFCCETNFTLSVRKHSSNYRSTKISMFPVLRESVLTSLESRVKQASFCSDAGARKPWQVTFLGIEDTDGLFSPFTGRIGTREWIFDRLFSQCVRRYFVTSAFALVCTARILRTHPD